MNVHGNQLNDFIQINRYLTANHGMLKSLSRTRVSHFLDALKPTKGEDMEYSTCSISNEISELLCRHNIGYGERIVEMKKIILNKIGKILLFILKLSNSFYLI